MVAHAIPALERIMKNRRVDLSTNCWLWTMGLSSQGYGHIKVYGRTRTAHRVSYELLVGPVPDGLILDHLCHTRDLACPGGPTCPHRRCVNPAHLEPVTSGENVKRGRMDIRSNLAAYQAARLAKPTCPRGHPWTEANTKTTAIQRHCRACQRENTAAWRRRRKEANGRQDIDGGDAIPRV